MKKKSSVTKNPKYIFVAGGVMSSVGKGVASASIAKIMQARGYRVTAMKVDPYVNVDAGNMNPTEHGEVFVLDDGTECDQDMGSYERYLNTQLHRDDYMTTGSVYLSVINRERNLEFGGRCVHVVPDIPLEVLARIQRSVARNNADIVVIEIGGTVGDYQNVLFLEAVRILKFKQPEDVLLALVSYVPSLGGAGGNELKTKPTQHAVQNLNSVGIHPDVILARSKVPLDDKRKEKLEFMCSLEQGSVVSAPDVKSIYDVPLQYERDGLGETISRKLHLKTKKPDFGAWQKFVRMGNSTTQKVKIAMVGKYFGTGAFVLHDSYISVIEALKHAGIHNRVDVAIDWVSSADIENKGAARALKGYAGIVVPGGFGSRGTEGMVESITYARTHNIPYLGLCYGMQMAAVEFARNVGGLKKANSTEIDKKTPYPIIAIMPDQEKKLLNREYGASMRLGGWDCFLVRGSVAEKAYSKAGWVKANGKPLIRERHRHRYEFNNTYREQLEKAGLRISGTSPDGKLVEVIELPKHPFFVGTQYHPEFLSSPLKPHPLFSAFIRATLKK